uniref:uncharacterized protein LOC105349558 n=1 Tax=Fragaria vesca subsp. vesca TaxID=101020 RepID=UPI0005C831EA|nr:PREDICTED: uncharacterized protein LOC105349558 [Fragaria vesca subsp. vesca]
MCREEVTELQHDVSCSGCSSTHNHRLPTIRKLESNSGEKALTRDARVFRKRAKATTTTNTTLASISTNCSAKQPKHMVHGIPEPSDDDLVDFRGLAILRRCYGSLLERACIGHPDLALCTKRSLRWREFAYETLGELLFFLTSTRRKEMVNKACEHLQILWEEAQGLGFDLSWLTPIVNSCLALDSKNSDVHDISAKWRP